MRKYVIFAVILVFCLSSLLFMVSPSKSIPATVGQYDPWMDVNDDGVINMYDLGYLARSFMATGTPLNKTDLLLMLQTNIDDLNSSLLNLEAQARAKMDSQDALIAELQNTTADLDTRLASQDALIADMRALIVSNNVTIAYLQSQIATLQNQVTNLQNQIAQLNSSTSAEEQLKLGSPYGWTNGTSTVFLRVTCLGGNVTTIAAVHINSVNCPTFTGTNGLTIAPLNSTVLMITYPGTFLSGFAYTFVVVTARNNEFQTTGQCPPTEEGTLTLGSPYGWTNGTNTVNLRVYNSGGYAVTIAAVRINGVNCPTFSGSSGLTIAPNNSTVLTITCPYMFLSGYSYTFVITTARNNEFQTTGQCP